MQCDGHPEKARIIHRMEQHVTHFLQDFKGPEKNIPTVVPPVATQVNTNSSEQDNRLVDQKPGMETSQAPEQYVELKHADEPVQQAGPRKRHDQHQIEPLRNGMAAIEVHKIGEDVRGIGQKQQPQQARQQIHKPFFRAHLQHEATDQQGQKSQEEIPHQDAVKEAAGVNNPEKLHPQAEHRGKQQDVFFSLGQSGPGSFLNGFG